MLANRVIAEFDDVTTEILSIEDAKKMGATALFGENTEILSASYRWEISARNCAAEHICAMPDRSEL